jgi:hypothetical protein
MGDGDRDPDQPLDTGQPDERGDALDDDSDDSDRQEEDGHDGHELDDEEGIAMFKGVTIMGAVLATIVGAVIGDMLAHPQGTTTAFKGLTGLYSTGLKGAAGGYSTPS